MPVSIETKPPLAWVWVDNPPVNALSHAVRSGLLAAVEELDGVDEIKAVILICRGRTFIAGADIREFSQTPKEPHLPDLIVRMEQAKKPWIAAIHGTALGGGCETAMGCHYRVAAPGAKLGLPEVNLGLIPGAGGTVRLPRLVGAARALEMVTGGKPVTARNAREWGLIDAVSPDDDLPGFAGKYAHEVAEEPLPPAVSDRPVDSASIPDDWQAALSGVQARARGQNSPYEAALAIRDAIENSAGDALKRERERFTRLRDSEQSAALRHVFFAERQTTKIERIKGVEPKSVDHVGIIGGGTMGAGIAAAHLLAGIHVTLVERDREAADAGTQRIIKILQNSHDRGVIDEARLEQAKAVIQGATDYAKLDKADLVIEAVFEDMNVKKGVFRKLDEHCKPGTILASNTSYLDINEIAETTRDPTRVLGLHFFSPAYIMKLVEVIYTDTVSDTALATGFDLARRLRKTPVLAGVCDGFIGNRILFAYRKQCDYMLEDGAEPQEIDAAMREFGMAMGPFEMQDLAGLDIGWANRKRLAPPRDPNERYVKIADRLCELGRFGQKTGSGWYRYQQGSRKGSVDPVVEKIISKERAAAGILPREFTSAEIQTRILDAMVSEGKLILSEGIARSASDIDVVMILGYGFPRWRGGPMFAAGISS